MRHRHSLHSSEDRNVQREYSHRTQFSNSHYEVQPGDIPRVSDSMRRSQFIAGILAPDRASAERARAPLGTPNSETGLEYKPPNMRSESTAMPMFQSTRGNGGCYDLSKTLQPKVTQRPASAIAATRATSKMPISTLESHPDFGAAKLGACSFDYVSTYMAMKPGAHRLQKSKGLTGTLNPIRSVSEW